jgi:N-acetylneuraminate synthase
MFNEEFYLVAELGINHNGDFETAKTLISKAATSGVNAIKFQYRNLSRTYESTPYEIGDESLKLEIEKNSLSVNEIILLYEYAKIFNVDVGISFFDKFDVTDFKSFISKFDFFKIPSVELTNLDLIKTFYQYHKPILISTGAHSEKEIEFIFKQIDYDKWVPMHCISNYPVIDVNSKLGYIKYMQDKWERHVGYSSHDENWENCILAYTLGARIIERHITLDKKQLGLDHSTSSTPEEFKKLSSIIRNFNQIISGNDKRKINQGELINLQNLSKSFFAKRSINAGESFELIDFNYRHPRVGLSMSNAQLYVGKSLVQPCKSGAVLTEAHFHDSLVLPSKIFDLCNKLKISLPIRLHDYKEIQEKFKINNFELHLSYKEVDKLELFKKIADNHVFTIHLPDYQDSNRLLNPFTDEYHNKIESKHMINVVKDFAIKLSKIQNEKVIVVASFSPNQETLSAFYADCYNLQLEFETAGITLAYQWLPPFAWYFGGSVKLNAFNKLSDLDFIKLHNLNICLDTSHLLMSSNYYGYDPGSVLEILEKQIVHFHLADAVGTDGEGIQLGQGETTNNRFLYEVINRPQRKVIEVWQGHLNLYQGFTDALLTIKDFTEDE